jgi:hypothetical protein
MDEIVIGGALAAALQITNSLRCHPYRWRGEKQEPILFDQPLLDR